LIWEGQPVAAAVNPRWRGAVAIERTDSFRQRAKDGESDGAEVKLRSAEHANVWATLRGSDWELHRESGAQALTAPTTLSRLIAHRPENREELLQAQRDL